MFGDDDDAEENEQQLQGQQHDTGAAEQEEPIATEPYKERPPKDMDAPRVCIPSLKKPVPRQQKMSSIRLPPVVTHARQAYDSVLYDEYSEEMELFKKGKQQAAENVIRWRLKRDEQGNLVKDSEGKPKMESNTKAVKWSDGSYTLHIGREAHHFLKRAGETEHAHMFTAQTAYGSTHPTEEEISTEGESCLEAIGPLTNRFVLRPAKIEGSSSRMAVLEARRRADRTDSGIKVTETLQNPEKEKEKRVREQDEVWRMRQRQSNALQRQKEAQKSQKGRRQRQTQLTENFLEADDDEEVEYEDVAGSGGLKELKRAVRSGTAGEEKEDDDDDDDEEMEDTTEPKTEEKKKTTERRTRGKRGATDEDEQFLALDEEGEDEEAEYEESEEGDGSDESSSSEESEDDDEDEDMEIAQSAAASSSSTKEKKKESSKKAAKGKKLKKRGQSKPEDDASSDEEVV